MSTSRSTPSVRYSFLPYILRIAARDCNLTNTDAKIRDLVVFATNIAKIQEKLINIGADIREITLDKTIHITAGEKC